jgi:hypothetical protein
VNVRRISIDSNDSQLATSTNRSFSNSPYQINRQFSRSPASRETSVSENLFSTPRIPENDELVNISRSNLAFKADFSPNISNDRLSVARETLVANSLHQTQPINKKEESTPKRKILPLIFS